MDNSQYLTMFIEESMDNLKILNDSLLELEQNPKDIDKLNEIFRVAHTIKGMGATMGFNKITQLTHKMEDVLTEFRNGELEVTKDVVTILFKCLDKLEQMINNISDGIDEDVQIDELMKELEGLINTKNNNTNDGNNDNLDNSKDSNLDKFKLNEYDLDVIKQGREKGYNAFKITIHLSENTILKAARAFLIFKNLEDYGEIIKSVPGTEDLENENFDFDISLVYLTKESKDKTYNLIMNIAEVEKVIIGEIDDKFTNKEQEKNVKDNLINELNSVKNKLKNNTSNKSNIKSTNTKRKKIHQSVRVELKNLDKIMNLISELVIHRTRLEQINKKYNINNLAETLEQIERTTSDLQEIVMKIRMLPLDVVFSRFPRMIRDLSVELNKEMELIIEGQDTELDRTVIDEIGEPILHLLRNSADHGIESKEERIQKGKDPVGKIKLYAYQEGTKAIIKVKDDGRGIDVNKIKEKAEKSGIRTDGMSDKDIINLIFNSGFSTSPKITDISGRGVGLDVVKTKINSLGGTVDLVSEIDKGTTFTIKLPLTLQIIQALLVKVGSETFALSLGYIDRVIDFDKKLIKKTNNEEVIIYDNKVIPFIRINERLDIKEDQNDKRYIIIVKSGEKTAGLLVDSLLGQQEIVIKHLGNTLKKLKEYIGATILDGDVTLILDVSALL